MEKNCSFLTCDVKKIGQVERSTYKFQHTDSLVAMGNASLFSALSQKVEHHVVLCACSQTTFNKFQYHLQTEEVFSTSTFSMPDVEKAYCSEI